jgi:predicted lipoprotein with Yx(FWY)xxD motif
LASIHSVRRWAARAVTVSVAVGAITATAVSLTAAQAAPAAGKKATVVKVVNRKSFKDMLARKSNGLSLYILPKGSCTGSCLSIWPPLLMPKGTTTPEGTKCLGTVKFDGRLQVTYRKKRLYTFASDHGSSVNGNGVAGFKVAKVSTGSCPKT